MKILLRASQQDFRPLNSWEKDDNKNVAEGITDNHGGDGALLKSLVSATAP